MKSYKYLDILFFILWVITQYYTRNILCQIAMLVFSFCMGVNILLNPNRKLNTSYFFLEYSICALGIRTNKTKQCIR